MSYKIAIASSDGVHIDETFGAAGEFHIYEVNGEDFAETEIRKVSQTRAETVSQEACGSQSGCGQGGCHGAAEGCSGGEGASPKVELIADCRCVVCKKIGFRIQKQLERKAITSFAVSCTIEEALEKIATYFYKVDTHQSLRGK